MCFPGPNVKCDGLKQIGFAVPGHGVRSMSLTCLVPWPANTRTSQLVELCRPNLPLQSTVQASLAANPSC